MRGLLAAVFVLVAVGLAGSTARAQTADDVAAAATQTCAVMDGTQKADSRTLQYLLLLDEDMGDANPVALALFHQVMARCPKSYLAYEQRKRAVNPFPSGSLTKQTPTQFTGGGAPSEYAMHCIGTKGMASYAGPTLSVAFRRASGPAALRAGQCTFLDRGVRKGEPALITGPIAGAGVAQRVAVDVNAGARWTFWVYNDGSSFHMTALAQGMKTTKP